MGEMNCFLDTIMLISRKVAKITVKMIKENMRITFTEKKSK